jgi:hypothetical protein
MNLVSNSIQTKIIIIQIDFILLRFLNLLLCQQQKKIIKELQPSHYLT